MSVPDERSIFTSRCLRVGAAAAAAGATLRKADGKVPALEVARGGKSVTFPIVTDARAWRETTVEEALYVVLVDARGWAGAKLDAPAAAAPEGDPNALPSLIKRDFTNELNRIKDLANVLGGEETLEKLFAAADV